MRRGANGFTLTETLIAVCLTATALWASFRWFLQMTNATTRYVNQAQLDIDSRRFLKRLDKMFSERSWPPGLPTPLGANDNYQVHASAAFGGVDVGGACESNGSLVTTLGTLPPCEDLYIYQQDNAHGTSRTVKIRTTCQSIAKPLNGPQGPVVNTALVCGPKQYPEITITTFDSAGNHTERYPASEAYAGAFCVRKFVDCGTGMASLMVELDVQFRADRADLSSGVNYDVMRSKIVLAPNDHPAGITSAPSY